MKRIVITGGAGFVGSSLAIYLKAAKEAVAVVAFDNLHRRGSELNLDRLAAAGVDFVHGDVRSRDDLRQLGAFDALVECSAEPSVLAGHDGDWQYLADTNLNGALICADACVRQEASMIFLSTSRIYPMEPLRDCAFTEAAERFELSDEQTVPGLSRAGVAESFPLEGTRSLYGASKYAAEVMLRDVEAAFNLPIVINRCGVVAGPWQFGRVDQGIASFWTKAHLRQQPLSYIGFGGTGKQVRDMLHIDDLCELVGQQLAKPTAFSGAARNVGGGLDNSVSLRELTKLCEELTGNRIEIASEPETRYADIPIFVTDSSRIKDDCGWQPTRSVTCIVGDIVAWLREQPDALASDW